MHEDGSLFGFADRS